MLLLNGNAMAARASSMHENISLNFMRQLEQYNPPTLRQKPWSQTYEVARRLHVHLIVCKKAEKQQKKQPAVQLNRHFHLYKRTAISASGTKAKSLVNIVIPLSNVKEEIYAALDEWVAFELEFPVLTVRKALERLKQQEQWQRIIQVSKWMLSKGQGQTFGTYDLMLKAYDMDTRLEDAEELWEKLVALYTRSIPKSMFSHMMRIYKRNRMSDKVLKVFDQMETLNVRPDPDTLRLIIEAYTFLGMPEKQEEISKKYPPRWKYYNFKGKNIRVRVRRAIEAPSSDGSGENVHRPEIEAASPYARYAE